MTPATTLLLIRHGETVDGPASRFHGWSDLPLSDTGQAQIVRLREYMGMYLRGRPLAAVYASDLQRSRQTADILVAGQDLRLTVLPALREINFGDLEGYLVEELPARFPATVADWRANPATCRFPNGESFQEAKQRVLPTVERLLSTHAGETIAMTLHSGINRIILGWALGLPDEHLVRLEQDHGCLNVIVFGPLYPCLRLHNFVPALTGASLAVNFPGVSGRPMTPRQ
ncbi:MAG: histidine phosphatase family protein [Acidobacteriota bacterium]